MPDWQPNAHVVLALDIGGTKTTAAIGTVDGEILSQETVDTRAKEGFERAWEVIADLTGRVLAQNNE
jgi:predicted NBD/HSP70 family sugar kinase